MRDINRLTRIHQKISQLENDGRFIESKKLHNKFIKEAAVPAYPYPAQYPAYPQYPVQQYPAYQQYPQYAAYYNQQAAYPRLQQQVPAQQMQQPTQPPAGQPNVQSNSFYYDDKTKQYYYKGKPVNQMSDDEVKKMQQEMFKK